MINLRKRCLQTATVSMLGLLTSSQASSTPAAVDMRPAAGVMRVGGMTVRLDDFLELNDGSVQAHMSFHNVGTKSVASFAIPKTTTDDSKTVVRLRNAEGDEYRLADLSEFGDASAGTGWVSVPPGESAFLTATFKPDGAARGVQPFALNMPVRMTWHPDDGLDEHTSAFEINFGGLRRVARDQEQQMPATPPAPVALLPEPPKALTPQAVASPRQVVASLPPATVPAPKFIDDLAPMIAGLRPIKTDAHRYLFAVGVEQYDDAPPVPFAERSARAMTDLIRKRYGVPEENAVLVTGADATGMKILGRLNSFIQRLQPGDTVYFYYTGHGVAARDGSNVYLMSKDTVPGAYEVEMLSLKALLQRLDKSNATRVVAFLDTCFSGRVGQKDSLFPGAAPLVPEPLPTNALVGMSKTTLFLAGQSYQLANDYPEHGYRLFSYFLMRGILQGNDDPANLAAYVAPEVRRVSSRRGAEFVQEPQLVGAKQTLAANFRN